ncbi:hypothetical protein TWF506_005748 [Arthrobotrys conoides]|uniref:DUF4246 domain-containing protein n=1 Tax=Arthrobotrys conoides TaxID=74498 RepID=A0AAN8NU83_9PEZI
MDTYRSCFGYQLNRGTDRLYQPNYSFYPHPADSVLIPPLRSYRDKILSDFSLYVRNQKDWLTKSSDRKTFIKWLEKACSGDYRRFNKKILAWGPEQIEFVWNETANYRDYVNKLREKGCMIQPDVDGVWRADNVISPKIKEELIAAVATLENVPDKKENWRAGSDGQILDLVDPFRWPVRFGHTLDQRTGKPLVYPRRAFIPSNTDNRYILRNESSSYFRLPSEFLTSEDGKYTQIRSYISNLHSPEQKQAFYPLIESIFPHFVALFEHVLAELASIRSGWTRGHGCVHDGGRNPGAETKLQRPKAGITTTDYLAKRKAIFAQFASGGPTTASYLDSTKPLCWRHRSCQNQKRACEGISHKASVIQVNENETPLDPRLIWTPPKFYGAHNLKGRSLKIILQLTNTLLTPQSPVYEESDSWHNQWSLNESIVAIGVYYYAEENITETRLKFETVCADFFRVNCRCGRSDFSVDRTDKIVTKEDRCIAYPNILKRKVESFELVDKTKPGYQKKLIFYLCEPSLAHEMPTSRIVAPQQPETTSMPPAM